MGGIANSNLFDLAQERVHESIIDAVLYVDTCSSSTILTAVDVTTDNGSIGSGFDIGILIDDKWSFATEFEVHALDGICTGSHNMFPAFGTTCN